MDAICDGEMVLIGGVEHIEQACTAVPCSLPAYTYVGSWGVIPHTGK
ncbi:hypothetical protein ACLB1R_31885 [Escherichia coli]